MIKKISLVTIATLLLQVFVQAQSESTNNDVMRSNGKIYVVMAVCLTILIGLIGYVIATDRKISKLEKEMK